MLGKHQTLYMSYDRFVDERLLTSRDALNHMQIKIKLLEIDEEIGRVHV